MKVRIEASARGYFTIEIPDSADLLEKTYRRGPMDLSSFEAALGITISHDELAAICMSNVTIEDFELLDPPYYKKGT